MAQTCTQVLYGVGEGGDETALPAWHGAGPSSGGSADSRRSFHSRRRHATDVPTVSNADADNIAEVWLEVPAGLDKDELLEAVLLAMPDLDGRIEGRRLADIEPNYGEGADVILQSTTAHMYAVRTLGGGGGG